MLPINNLYGGLIKGSRKETGKFSHHVICEKLDNITQKEMDNMFYIVKAKNIDKNNIYTYISKLALIKIIVYLVYTVTSSFSVLVKGARFGNGWYGCKASRWKLY